MKKISVIFMLTILLAGAGFGALPTPSYSQVYYAQAYPAPGPQPYGTPWVGPNTPWVYYNGDWFLNGVLHYFFGPKYGWAPYYAYPRVYVVRPAPWYGPRWSTWYREHPVYVENFHRHYPHWKGHKVGRHYDPNFHKGRGHDEGRHNGRHNG